MDTTNGKEIYDSLPEQTKKHFKLPWDKISDEVKEDFENYIKFVDDYLPSINAAQDAEPNVSAEIISLRLVKNMLPLFDLERAHAISKKYNLISGGIIQFLLWLNGEEANEIKEITARKLFFKKAQVVRADYKVSSYFKVPKFLNLDDKCVEDYYVKYNVLHIVLKNGKTIEIDGTDINNSNDFKHVDDLERNATDEGYDTGDWDASDYYPEVFEIAESGAKDDSSDDSSDDDDDDDEAKDEEVNEEDAKNRLMNDEPVSLSEFHNVLQNYSLNEIVEDNDDDDVPDLAP